MEIYISPLRILHDWTATDILLLKVLAGIWKFKENLGILIFYVLSLQCIGTVGNRLRESSYMFCCKASVIFEND